MKALRVTSAMSISIVASLFFTIHHRGQAQPTNASTRDLHAENQTINNSSTKVQPATHQNSNGVRTLIGDRYMNCAVTADRSGMICTEEGRQGNSHWKVKVYYEGFYPPSFQSN